MTNPIPSSPTLVCSHPMSIEHVLQAALNSLKFKQPEPSASNTLIRQDSPGPMTDPWDQKCIPYTFPMDPMGDVLVLFFLVAVGSCNEWRRSIWRGVVLLHSGLGVGFVDMVKNGTLLTWQMLEQTVPLMFSCFESLPQHGSIQQLPTRDHHDSYWSHINLVHQPEALNTGI